MTISDHVRRLRALPSTTDDRRGRKLREFAGRLLWHGGMYHAQRSARLGDWPARAKYCNGCWYLGYSVTQSTLPGPYRAVQLAVEDYEPITSADW